MSVFVVVLIVAMAAAGVALNFVGGSSCEERLSKWVAEHHYSLVSVTKRSLGGGNPWGLWGTGRGTRFYEVTIVDDAGVSRVGWVRIRAGIRGIGTGRLDVRWQ